MKMEKCKVEKAKMLTEVKCKKSKEKIAKTVDKCRKMPQKMRCKNVKIKSVKRRQNPELKQIKDVPNHLNSQVYCK
jgi:hypothetical protein